MSRTVTVIALAIFLGTFAWFRGAQDMDVLIEFMVWPRRESVQLLPMSAAEHHALSRRFSAACAFVAIAAVVAGGWIYPCKRHKWAVAAAAGRVLLFAAIGGLALCTAAAYFQSKTSYIVEARSHPDRMPKVQIHPSDLPLVRVPVIAGITVLIVAALVRAIITRRAKSAERRVSPERAEGNPSDR